MRVLLTWYARDTEIAQVRAGLPQDWEVVAPVERPHMSRWEISHADVADLAPAADAFMGWVVPPETWAAAPKLKALAWLHAGCDELDFAMLKRRGIQVANIRGGNGIAVAEHAMALMLAVTKRVVQRHRWVQEAHWQPTWHPDYAGTLLDGRTLGVIGLGMIGTAVARRARAFDMRVLGIRRHPERGGEHVEAVYGPEALHDVLGQADVVVLATPITAETDGFFGAAEIAAMKPGAFLVNIARGNLIHEQSLYDALTGGHLGGYAADVWWTYTNSLPATYHYPIPSRTGLQKLPNVVATGDQAANVVGVTGITLDMGTESLAAFARGEPMPRAIDLDLGY